MTRARERLLRAVARAVLAWLPLAAGLVLGALAFAPPAPVGGDAPADAFSAARAREAVERLLGDGSAHPVGSAANDAVRERLLAELTALGLEPELQRSFACNLRFEVCAEVVNVIAPLPGGQGGPAVVLTAHYDSVAAAPGAADDIAGVAAVLEAARALLAGEPTRNPVVLLFTDGEEAGLLGARAFLRHPLASEVGVVANLEARGSRGASFLFETSEHNAWLIRAFAAQARRAVTSSLLYEMYRLLPNDTDLTEYRAAGIAGVNFAFVGGLPHYHTPLDTPANLSPASLQHHGENALAAARAYGAADLADIPAGGALYTYVAPGLVLVAPLGWALPLSVIGLAAVVVTVPFVRRRGRMTLAGWGLGVVTALAAVAAAGLLATGLSGLVALARPEAEPWYANPLPTRVAVWAAGIVATSLLTAAVARSAGRWGLTLGAWTVWGAITVAAAVTLPGATAELLVPLLVAGALHLAAAALGRGRRGWSTAATAASSLVAAYFWLPLALDVESGLGLAFAGAVAALVALVATTAAPLLVPPDERYGRRDELPTGPGETPPADRRGPSSPAFPRRPALLSGYAAAAVTLASVALALAVPAYDELWPRRLSLMHLQEWEEGELTASRWVADAYPGGPLPGDLAGAADWREPVDLLPWSGAAYGHAPARPVATQPPTLEVVSVEEGEDERLVTVRLGTSAPPLRVVLGVSADAGLAAVRFVGAPTEWDFSRVAGLEDREVHCYGVTCDGRLVELALRGQAPYELYVAEIVAGLPDEGAALLAARPSTAVPSQDGDVTVQLHRLTLP